MKTGLSLEQMATELQRRNDAKRDFVADTRSLRAVPGPQTTLNLALPGAGSKVINMTEGEVFQEQVCGHYKIPRDYAGRIRVAHPALYAETLNTHFQKEPARRMVRVLDGTARAFLSDRYRPLDDFDLGNAVLPELMNFPDINIVSSAFTERRFYLKAVFPRIEAEVKKGDPVQIGLVISNSEVGAGSLAVLPLVYRLICLNGMIAEDYGQRKYHVGKRASSEESAYELYTDRTRQLDDAAFFSKVRDTVKGVLTHETLNKLTAKLRDATEQPIENTLQNVVELTAKKFGYSERTQDNILRHLAAGGDLTRYGLMNAVTRASQDEQDYETATRMETDGARVIELPKTEWTALAAAA
jgi:hypothetical protein